ncbi:universal stress protein [Qaidamihabitans albus]|uniref:universal stress protein n=1 Tax=Qaidamihabitans albus TaxID=2795733 RepID=UPI0018F257B5|nr:universal stress protein [Qaidamihabitans albus]
MSEERPNRVIVVGVDGSAGSADALHWAVQQAKVSGARVRAITAWEFPMTFGYPISYTDFDWEGAAKHTLEATVAKVAGSDPDVVVTREAHRGHAGNVLVDASHDAELLVVGSRGHGTVAGMLLGSISQHCVQHAACPVVVVRPERAGRDVDTA